MMNVNLQQILPAMQRGWDMNVTTALATLGNSLGGEAHSEGGMREKGHRSPAARPLGTLVVDSPGEHILPYETRASPGGSQRCLARSVRGANPRCALAHRMSTA